MMEEKLTAKATLVNIKNYDLYEFYDYKLPKSEAEVVIRALEFYIENVGGERTN